MSTSAEANEAVLVPIPEALPRGIGVTIPGACTAQAWETTRSLGEDLDRFAAILNATRRALIHALACGAEDDGAPVAFHAAWPGFMGGLAVAAQERLDGSPLMVIDT